jgi:hypothetical protein
MTADETPKKHHRIRSSLDDFSLLTLDHAAGQKGETQHSELQEIEISTETPLPKSALIIVSETEQLEKNKNDDTATLVASLTDIDFTFSKLKVHSWDCTKQYSDFIKEGLEYKGVKIDDYENVVMLFESPSSSSDQSSFHNRGKFVLLFRQGSQHERTRYSIFSQRHFHFSCFFPSRQISFS